MVVRGKEAAVWLQSHVSSSSNNNNKKERNIKSRKMLVSKHTTIEKRYDELVVEILRRLEENNLHMKPEKYKWKVRKVDFLEVVLRP